MLTMLLGTDWTANRDSILNMIARDVSEEKRNRILIVPELISHDTERRLCVSAGDTCSRFAEVLSFTRLFDRVMETIECGVQECLDNGGRVVAMAAAVRNLHSKLKSYASVETRPEFLIGLVDAIDEFKRCCITAQELLWASRQTEGIFAQKLEELSLIFDAYEAFCQRGKRDPRDQMTWLLEQLEDCDFARDHVFYIDGFPDFTRQHAAILEHLIVNAEHVIISMNCDEVGSLTPGFERAGATAASLISYAKSAQIPVNVKQVAPNIVPLQIMRENLFQGRIQADIQASECLRVYQTETVYEECLAAAEQIMTLVRSGVRYRDINIVCADMNIYRDPLRTVMNRCKIPIYLSGTEDILNRPVITTVLAAIDAALGGFEQQETMRYLKSALSPLTLDACDKLENYAIRWGINGSEWTKEWTKHPEGLGEAWTEETLSDLMNLNRIRKNAIEPLEGLCRDFRNATNLRQQILAVYRFLEQIQFAERLSELADDMDKQGKNSDAQVLNQLWEILLTALEQMYDVLGETVWDADTFARLLRLLLSQYDVGTIPSVLDSVTIGPVSAMRCQQVDHLIVLGALEGALPGYSGSAGVFTDQERTALRHLGVPLTGGALDGLQISFSEIYGVFCGAQKSVSVSCPAGQASFLFRRLRDLAGGVRPVEVTFGAARADKIEAAAFLAAFGDKETAQKLGLKDAYEQIDEKKNYQFGTVTNENVVKLYGACLNLSASQIDKHADCRFSYFLKYGLRLKERVSASVDPAEFGTYIHAVLELTCRKVMEMGGFSQVTLDKTLEIARDYSQSYAQERFSELDCDRTSYLFLRNSQELELIICELWQELHDAQFAPIGFEVAFGSDGGLDAIVIPNGLMPAQLRGFVDRVDAWDNSGCCYFRVVDYKTGRKDFDYCDVFNGLGLQMLLYLFALEDSGTKLLGPGALPAGVQYFPARVPLIASDSLLSQEDAKLARDKLWKRKGLLLQDPQVLSAMDPGEMSTRLCYTRKADGTLVGDLADRKQFNDLKKYVFSLLKSMVDEIASGHIEPNPYTRGSSHNACAFCPYGSVCHAESVEGRRNYQAMSARRFWEEIEKEVKKHG